MSDVKKITDQGVNGTGGMIMSSEQAVPPSLFDPAVNGPRFYVSFDPSTETGFCKLMLMKHGESKPLAERINELVDLVNFYVAPMEKEDEKTGEIITYPRIVLELEDGSLLSCGSHGVFASLADMLKYRRTTPWEPPFRVKVIAKSLPGGHRYFVLLPVLSVQATAKKGGK